jgi:hypothetical protein
VQGRVVPFARRKETSFRAPTPAPGARSAATTRTRTDEGGPETVAPRLYPSLEEMMAESDERVVAEMRRERAKVQFSEGPIRPQSKQVSRWVAGVVGVIVVSMGLGFGAWKLQQQHQADALLSAAVVPPVSAPNDPQPLPPPLVTRDAHEASGTQIELPKTRVPEPAAAVVTPAMPPPLQTAAKPAAPVEIPLAPPAAGRPAVPAPDDAPAKPVKEVASPLEVCGERIEFALYNCMKTQCDRARWSKHPQCQRLRDTDEVIP